MNRQSGFTLIEIMVAGALLAGLALAGAKLMETQTKSMKTVEVRSEYNAVITDIRSLLAVQETCTATFLGLSPNAGATVPQHIRVSTPSNPTVITRYQANPDWRAGNAYGNGAVRILSYRLVAPDPGDPQVPGIPAAAPTPPATTKTGAANLIMRFHFGEGRTVGAETIERRIRINYEITHPGNTIVKCTSAGSVGLDARYVWTVGGSNGEMTGDLTMRNSSRIILQAGSELHMQSDRRLKSQITPIKESLAKLRKIRPVSYNWNETGSKDYGVIAQDLQKIFPDLVHTHGPEKVLTVNYLKLTPFLLQGLQEMDKENQELKNMVNQMQEDHQLLKAHLCNKDPEAEFCNSK